jgi:hypothetical protein
MDISQAKELLFPFFKMKEFEILDQFARLSPDSICRKNLEYTDYSFTFVPGQRQDRVLLVAHVDTVWHDSKKVKVACVSNNDHEMLISGSRKKGTDKDGDPYVYGMGIGADDRAGCAILWGLKDLGHSLLLVSGEEYGSLGSHFAMSNKKMARTIQAHQFVVQFDRHGHNDLVFYDVGTKEFKKYCEESTGYKTAAGTRTDICVLCREICGVNISVGYSNEHTCSEVLNITDWMRTFETAKKWLSQNNLPTYEL